MYRVLGCLTNEHDYRLVLVAIAICVVTTWTAWRLYAISLKTPDLSRLGWLLQTGVAAGSGIWATHFIAMLAFKSSLTTSYDPALTLLSLVIAILVTSVGFFVAEMVGRTWGVVAGGTIIGLGIAAMHYSGMGAMAVLGTIEWDPVLVTFSVALGVIFATLALWSFMRTRSAWLAALLLTLGICTLHFTAMGAAMLQFDPTVAVSPVQIDNTLMATAIAAVTILVLLSGLTASLVDYQTRKENQAKLLKLRHVADHDHLTGLPNRGFIERVLETAIRRPESRSTGFALLFIDLDHFKEINDTLGHPAGDQVLRLAAHRLREAVSDRAIVGRAGGDEFIVLQTEVTLLPSVGGLASAIAAAFKPPFEMVDGSLAYLGVSIGVSIFPKDGEDSDSMIKSADLAMYRAKRLSRGAALAGARALVAPRL
jgi:diguanylate cyclase